MIPKNLLIFLLLIFLILGVIFLWWPKYQEISALRIKIKEKDIELQNKEEYFSKLAQFSQELKKYSQEINIIDSGLPADPSVLDTLKYLERESSENGLILENFKLIETSISPKREELKETSLSFSVSGPYPSFKNFLSQIQKSARLIEVESISFTSPKEEEIFSFDLKIKTYSY